MNAQGRYITLVYDIPLNKRVLFERGRNLLETLSRTQPGVFDRTKAPPKFRRQGRVDER